MHCLLFLVFFLSASFSGPDHVKYVFSLFMSTHTHTAIGRLIEITVATTRWKTAERQLETNETDMNGMGSPLAERMRGTDPPRPKGSQAAGPPPTAAQPRKAARMRKKRAASSHISFKRARYISHRLTRSII